MLTYPQHFGIHFNNIKSSPFYLQIHFWYANYIKTRGCIPRDDQWLLLAGTQELCLFMLRRPYGMLEIKPRSIKCKTSALSISLVPVNSIFELNGKFCCKVPDIFLSFKFFLSPKLVLRITRTSIFQLGTSNHIYYIPEIFLKIALISHFSLISFFFPCSFACYSHEHPASLKIWSKLFNNPNIDIV